VRLGWCTNKAELQAPVGFDAHGYSYRYALSSMPRCNIVYVQESSLRTCTCVHTNTLIHTQTQTHAHRDLEGSKVHQGLREPYGGAYKEGDVVSCVAEVWRWGEYVRAVCCIPK
jgi:Set1/Ash2 histone methyltransferase complex subunit ASH2